MAGTCEACGRSSAAPIKLKRNVGPVVVHRAYTVTAVLCATCADTVTSEFQKETIVKGWTSPRSALLNPGTIAANAFLKHKHRKQLGN